MGFSWDLANEQAETLKDEITVSAPEALQLVSKILRIPSSRGQYAKQMQYKVQHLNQMIDQQVLDTVKNLNLPDELSLSHRLQRLSDRVEEYKKNQLLKNRAIIGMGGSFSAGKSSFINSLFGTNMLPENTTTTTAIPTYFMNGEEQQILAQYTGWGGLPDAFDPNKSAWADEYSRLKAILSESEYEATRSSTLTSLPSMSCLR